MVKAMEKSSLPQVLQSSIDASQAKSMSICKKSCEDEHFLNGKSRGFPSSLSSGPKKFFKQFAQHVQSLVKGRFSCKFTLVFVPEDSKMGGGHSLLGENSQRLYSHIIESNSHREYGIDNNQDRSDLMMIDKKEDNLVISERLKSSFTFKDSDFNIKADKGNYLKAVHDMTTQIRDRCKQWCNQCGRKPKYLTLTEETDGKDNVPHLKANCECHLYGSLKGKEYKDQKGRVKESFHTMVSKIHQPFDKSSHPEQNDEPCENFFAEQQKFVDVHYEVSEEEQPSKKSGKLMSQLIIMDGICFSVWPTKTDLGSKDIKGPNTRMVTIALARILYMKDACESSSMFTVVFSR